jgi:hypothetical protein
MHARLPSFFPSSLSFHFLSLAAAAAAASLTLSPRPSFLSDSRFVVSETAKKGN